AYRTFTPNASVRSGTRMIPPPSPVSAPMRPAPTDARAIRAANVSAVTRSPGRLWSAELEARNVAADLLLEHEIHGRGGALCARFRERGLRCLDVEEDAQPDVESRRHRVERLLGGREPRVGRVQLLDRRAIVVGGLAHVAEHLKPGVLCGECRDSRCGAGAL